MKNKKSGMLGGRSEKIGIIIIVICFLYAIIASLIDLSYEEGFNDRIRYENKIDMPYNDKVHSLKEYIEALKEGKIK